MVHDVSYAIVYLSGRHLLSGPSPCSQITGDHCVRGSESRYGILLIEICYTVIGQLSLIMIMAMLIH